MLSYASKFGIIPKGYIPGKWCLITELSALAGLGVNDGINPTICSLTCITVDQVAAVAAPLGVGSLLAKIDLQSAYRIVPVTSPGLTVTAGSVAGLSVC